MAAVLHIYTMYVCRAVLHVGTREDDKMKIACKYGGTVESISTTTIDKDWRHAKVTVRRVVRVWNEQTHDNDYQYIEHVYTVSWYGAALNRLEQWAGAQAFGAPRGRINIAAIPYVHGISASACYIVHRMKRKETKRRWY